MAKAKRAGRDRPRARTRKKAAGKPAKTPARGSRPRRRRTKAKGTRTAKSASKTAAGPTPSRRRRAASSRNLRLDRERRTLPDERVPTPPSSLDLDRHSSAVRSGRHAMAVRRRQHTEATPSLTGGDVDADWGEAYFSGEEAPGGDNPTPDQDVVDDIGRALGVQYADNEELRASDKIAERDKRRWELDPASSDDYKDRD